MEVVHRAWHRWLEQEVALKRLTAEARTQEALLERFRRESKAVASLRGHPNVVAVHDAGQDEEGPFLIMELMGGGSLEDHLQGNPGPLPPAEVARLFDAICAGMEAAHAQGVIHRDLKPGNVLLTRDGVPKVCEFGLARLGTSSGVSLQTVSGVGMGTPGYMAPEQGIDAARVDHRADIFSLGCLLYRMVTGYPPPPRGGLRGRRW